MAHRRLQPVNLNLYKTPSTEIIRHRKEFYGLWKRCDDQTTTWLNRLQNQINRCAFPPVMSREYLLIDKFVCELDGDERELIQSVNTWTLSELIDHFKHRKMNTGCGIQSSHTVNAATDQNQQQQIPLVFEVK